MAGSKIHQAYVKHLSERGTYIPLFDCSEEEYRNKARKLGIELGKLEYNPGLRFIAKICLNSLWGKFGQVQSIDKINMLKQRQNSIR